MKITILLLIMLLTSCASMESFDNEQFKRKCPIGYHLDQVNTIELFKPKKPESEDSSSQESVKKTRFSRKLKCVSDVDQNEFLKQHN